MAFVKIDRNNADAYLVGDLLSAIDQVQALHAALNKLQLKMAQMSTAQLDQYYGVPGLGGTVRTTITDAFVTLDTNTSLVKIRTMIG